MSARTARYHSSGKGRGEKADGAVVVSRPDGIGTLRLAAGARMVIRIGRASRHDVFTDHTGAVDQAPSNQH